MLRSGWYRLLHQRAAGQAPLLVVTAAGDSTPRVRLQWPPDEQAAAGHHGGSMDSPTSVPRRPGVTCAHLTVRHPEHRHPGPAGRRRPGLGAAALDRPHTTADSAGAHAAERWAQRTGVPGIGWWLVFPANARSATNTAPTRHSKWRILPGPVRRRSQLTGDGSHGGGPLGITELLMRATTVASYLKDDWFRTGALQRLTPIPRRPAWADLGNGGSQRAAGVRRRRAAAEVPWPPTRRQPPWPCIHRSNCVAYHRAQPPRRYAESDLTGSHA